MQERTVAAHSPDLSLSSWVPPLLLSQTPVSPCPLSSPAGVLSWDLGALLSFGVPFRAKVHKSEPWSHLHGGEEHPGCWAVCCLPGREEGARLGVKKELLPPSLRPAPPSSRSRDEDFSCFVLLV